VVNNQLQFNPGTAFDHLAQGAVEHVTLSYTMQDEFGAVATSTVDVAITGSNDAPVAVADSGVSITQNGGVDVSFFPILNAHATGVGSEYVITQAIDSQAGALWSNSKVSLNTSFTISAELFFGANDDGADGSASSSKTSPKPLSAPPAAAWAIRASPTPSPSSSTLITMMPNTTTSHTIMPRSTSTAR